MFSADSEKIQKNRFEMQSGVTGYEFATRIVFFAIGNNSTSFFYLETIISSRDVLLVISMKESEPISHKNPRFKEKYPLDDACFILDYYGRNK